MQSIPFIFFVLFYSQYFSFHLAPQKNTIVARPQDKVAPLSKNTTTSLVTNTTKLVRRNATISINTDRFKIYKFNLDKQKDGKVKLTDIRSYTVLNIKDEKKRKLIRHKMNQKVIKVLYNWYGHIGKCFFNCLMWRKGRSARPRGCDC